MPTSTKNKEGSSHIMIDAFRARADELGSARAAGRFRPDNNLFKGADRDRLVAQAVTRAKAGDQEALRFLYVRYADNVYGYVRSIVRDEHEAEDVTQQIFAKLLTALDRYEPRVVPFSAWVLRIARNAAIDHVRARRPEPSEEPHAAAAPDVAAARERFAELRCALDALPREQRDVILLRFLIGLTPGEIAVRLGRSEDAVHGL